MKGQGKAAKGQGKGSGQAAEEAAAKGTWTLIPESTPRSPAVRHASALAGGHHTENGTGMRTGVSGKRF